MKAGRKGGVQKEQMKGGRRVRENETILLSIVHCYVIKLITIAYSLPLSPSFSPYAT